MLRRVSVALAVSVAAATERARWTAAGDVATFLELEPPPDATLPLTLNVFFIGFHGEGAAGLNITEAQLNPWFQQLRARLPHSVLPADVEASPHVRAPPARTAVSYATRLRVLRLGPEVTARVEALLQGHLRPEMMDANPPLPTAPELLQVEAHSMSSLLASLAAALKLPGYCLFIMNPRKQAPARYG